MDRRALQELVTTRYVSNHRSEPIEHIRAISSILTSNEDDAIENHHEHVELIDDSTPLHGCVDTPKLIMKRPTIIRDEAAKVLMRIKTVSGDERHDYYTQKWHNTTRDSELELIKYIYLHPNSRPYFFSMQCRMLKLGDIADILVTSLLAEPRERGQCLSRIAVKTSEMTFAQLIQMLDDLSVENDGFQVTDVSIIATLIEKNNVVHRLKTKQYREYARLEPLVDEKGSIMSSRATLTCSISGKRHVQTQIVYYNNGHSRYNSTIRTRFIDIEQQVKSMCRQIVIDEDRNETVEYQIDNEMLPLRLGIPMVQDLIEYLETGELPGGDEL